ncbi:hypothetical protein DFJ73DRAFT_832797 [Zopfochytrium polystomum]|nr:hypothetical protein DFJ73DRAFT_832797 [Zopfochytrium polystomum]
MTARASSKALLLLLLAIFLIAPSSSAWWASSASGFATDQSNYGNYHAAGQEFRARVAERVQTAMYKMAGTKKPAGTGPNGEVIPQQEDLYYFFTLSDFNNDGHLDGHELRNSFVQLEVQADLERRGRPDENGHYARQRLPLRDVEAMVDHALSEDDVNNDGLISWTEYLASQERHKQMQRSKA